MEDEEAAVHHFVELLERVDGQVDEHAEHLIVDAVVTDADKTWLQ